MAGMLKELKNSKELIKVHVEIYGNLPEVSITLKASEGIKTREHKGVYHLPSSSSQVGAIVNLDSMRDHLCITISSPKPDTKFSTRTISHINYFYDSFQYPLLIPNGDMGYSFHMKRSDRLDGTTRVYGTLTPCMFYASLYMEREGVFNYITKCRRLFQQFTVDNYVKVETSRLIFLEKNKKRNQKGARRHFTRRRRAKFWTANHYSSIICRWP